MRGVALYLAIMIMGVLLTLALGVSAILYSQIKVAKGMGNSVMAFYAANSGIERELYEENPTGTTYSDYLDNGASYTVTVVAAGEGNCPVDVNRCIKSVGAYKETKRAIQIIR